MLLMRVDPVVGFGAVPVSSAGSRRDATDGAASWPESEGIRAIPDPTRPRHPVPSRRVSGVVSFYSGRGRDSDSEAGGSDSRPEGMPPTGVSSVRSRCQPKLPAADGHGPSSGSQAGVGAPPNRTIP